MIYHYNKQYGIKPISKTQELEALERKIQEIDAEISSGKRKVYSEKDMLRKHPHLKDI